MTSRYILFLLLGIDALILFFQISELSISYYEAKILYGEFSFLQLITNFSLNIFGHNDFGLRLPMMLLHLFSVILLYLNSNKYLKYERNKIWLVLIFILLPGSISSALQINSAGLLIFGLFLFVYIYENFNLKYTYILLPIYSLIDGGFLYLFLSLIFYAYYIKDKIFFIVNLTLFSISMYIYGLNAHGLPSGHLLDALAVYFAIFSPIVFIYLFYILYKKLYTKKVNLVWFISFIPLIFSLFLSLRQRVELDEFAPYIMLALLLGAEIFTQSYRVRLKVFRKKYKIIFIVSLVFLLLNSLVVLFNKELYKVMENPKKHCAYKMYIVKELSIQLKELDINCIDANDDLSYRLKFYGITQCDRYMLNEEKLTSKNKTDVTISYKNIVVYKANVTKINNE